MNLTVEIIQKYDKIVREKYPVAQMRKILPSELTWVNEYATVAILKALNGKVLFKWQR